MNISLNQILCIALVVILAGIFITTKPRQTNPMLLNNNASDTEICGSLTAPSSLPFVSYNTEQGFNECVSRCISSAMMQVCNQLPKNSNVFASQPQIKQQMLEGCTENIKHFVRDRVRCPYVNCEP